MRPDQYAVKPSLQTLKEVGFRIDSDPNLILIILNGIKHTVLSGLTHFLQKAGISNRFLIALTATDFSSLANFRTSSAEAISFRPQILAIPSWCSASVTFFEASVSTSVITDSFLCWRCFFFWACSSLEICFSLQHSLPSLLTSQSPNLLHHAG